MPEQLRKLAYSIAELSEMPGVGNRSTVGRRIPFADRPTCSVDDAVETSGLSRSMLYEKMKSGEVEWKKIGARRLIKVPSLLRLLGMV